MVSFKFVAVLALSALGVEALPSSSRSESALVRRAQQCNLKSDRPADMICGSVGYINNDSGDLKFPEYRATPGECMDLCHKTLACSSILWREGLCQPFAGSVRDAGFYENKLSLSTWYEQGCFECVEGKRSLPLSPCM
jgi:hypothetical protein